MSGNDFASRISVPDYIGNYKITKVLGRGGFAVVVHGVHNKTNEEVAIKIVDRIQMHKNQMFNYLESELRLASRFDHPNIIKVYDIIYLQDVICIVMEYVDNGDLSTHLTAGLRFSFEDQLRITRGLIDALRYLHSHGIAHRDIKPSNILFDKDFNPKLIDFGMSTESASKVSTICGTTFFIAPEVFKNQEYNGIQSDIWSLGITLHIMSTMQFPFDDRSESRHVNNVKNGRIELMIEAPGLIGQVVEKCLVVNPKLRPSSADILKFIDQYELQNPQIKIAKVEKRQPTALSLPHLTRRLNKVSDTGNREFIIKARNPIPNRYICRHYTSEPRLNPVF